VLVPYAAFVLSIERPSERGHTVGHFVILRGGRVAKRSSTAQKPRHRKALQQYAPALRSDRFLTSNQAIEKSGE
jgi:hypothetical protein